ncbi:putative isomerase YbhE [Durotheca rogersii]|uniref:putative isomerase YbhE n=1 Tax=Durotheca rogersii TaxID=419775 RepID=UPI002220E014|nr:putative isomerase YbhE [Durotheca rogersii]KAI5860481.1 putative isomerase YbhE [Durotheca rogersii]
MFRTFTTLMLALSSVTSVSAAVMARQNQVTHKLVVGAPFQVLTADFDGKKFSITGNHTAVGTGPSWLLYKDPTHLYAVNENANDTSLFSLSADLNNPTVTSATNGSSGVVFLEFNSDKTRIVGTAYGAETIDVWDVTADDGSLKLLKTLPVPGVPSPGQAAHRPHQAILDPTGRFFVIPNLGGDTLLVLDSKDDRYEITSNATLPAGSGPRHGGFLTRGDTHYYAVATEISNELFLYELQYADDRIEFAEIQRQSTYGTNPPANATTAAAAELVVARNQRDVYVSNRISGNETDSIAHFRFGAAGQLDFAGSVSSGGLRPRMFSLSKDEKQTLAFVANQGGDAGLVAFHRCPSSGALHSKPAGTLASSELIPFSLATEELVGPQFVLEI